MRMSQKGGKSFFRDARGERKRIHLGKYPSTPLKQAREKARALLLNPAACPNGKSLAEAFDAFFQSAIQPNYKPRSAKEVHRIFLRHMRTFAERPVISVTTSDLSALFSRRSQTPTEANHLPRCCSGVDQAIRSLLAAAPVLPWLCTGECYQSAMVA
jgi:hypothetical protein